MEGKEVLQFNPQAVKEIKIATATSRYSKTWKTRTMKWGEVVKRLSETVRTKETAEEYRHMKKAEQGQIKDVGGFVGGSIKGGQRKNESVQDRWLITLDLDFVTGIPPEDLWYDFTMFHGEEAVMYSTHSSTPKKPRLRLVMPVDRPLTPDEYEPAARKVAEDIGLDYFDDTTFEVARLMYWPSTPIDGEFIFYHQQGNFVSADDLLGAYDNWRDVSEWPTSSRQNQIIARAIKRQEDPLEKKGIVGAFCRAYPIEEALSEFLSDEYEPTKREDRYTYTKGSTFGGLVLYDSKFAYSHHGTDPTSGKLCNAFDLVRLHRFGGLDADAKEDTPPTRMPSYLKMADLARLDPRVKKQVIAESMAQAEEDFDFDAEEDTDWASRLTLDKNGHMSNTISNIVLVMENAPHLKDKFRYDCFSNRATVEAGVPWSTDTLKHEWQDLDDSGLHDYLESVYSLGTMQKVEDAKNLVFDRHKVHPVRDYLSSLPAWDGIPRVETLFVDYLGAEDNIYTRETAKVHLVAAVKRIYHPGAKYDTMVILAGKQGLGKSTLIRLLAKDWYSDSLYTIHGKEAAELIQGVWHVELGEMSAMKKSDRDAVKAFLSKNDDMYRVAYARNTTRFPRQCVFWGTSNEYAFLRDPTGDRRSLPIDCGITKPKFDIFDHTLEPEIDQIWAEAKYYYNDDYDTYLKGEAKEMSIKAQEDHKEDSPWAGPIQSYLEAEYPANWSKLTLFERQMWIKGEDDPAVYSEERIKLDKVCALQIWCELFEGKKQNLKNIDTLKINDILTALPGWERSKKSIRFDKIYGVQKGFLRVLKM